MSDFWFIALACSCTLPSSSPGGRQSYIGVQIVCKHIWGALLTWLVREEHPLVFGFVPLLPELFFEGLEEVYSGNKRCFGNLAEDHDLSLAPAYEPEGGAGLNGSGTPLVSGQSFQKNTRMGHALAQISPSPLPPDIRLLLFSQGRDMLCSRETSDRARLGG